MYVDMKNKFSFNPYPSYFFVLALAPRAVSQLFEIDHVLQVYLRFKEVSSIRRILEVDI